jgi:hypothetical protein
MTLARSLRLLLALALLLAWQNALVHPLAHVGHDGGLVHLEGGHDQDSGASLDCDAIAAVAAVIGGGSLPVAFAAPESDRVVSTQAIAAPAARLLAYRSQAPPQHS